MPEEKKPEDSAPPAKKPYVNPLNKLTEEDWRDAMRKGIEQSDSQAASLREEMEGRWKKKETKDDETNSKE